MFRFLAIMMSATSLPPLCLVPMVLIRRVACCVGSVEGGSQGNRTFTYLRAPGLPIMCGSLAGRSYSKGPTMDGVHIRVPVS